MAARAVVVVAGGGPPDAAVLDRLPTGAVVVAADSGVDTALALGPARRRRRRRPRLGHRQRAWPRPRTAAPGSMRHPVDKDATDLALALDEAAAPPRRHRRDRRRRRRRRPPRPPARRRPRPRRRRLAPACRSEPISGRRRSTWCTGRASASSAGPSATCVSLVPVGGAATGVRDRPACATRCMASRSPRPPPEASATSSSRRRRRSRSTTGVAAGRAPRGRQRWRHP